MTAKCRWDKMDGVCFTCGAGPDEECEIERERRQATATANRIIADQNRAFAEAHAALLRGDVGAAIATIEGR
jgi:hypothetical protein